MKWRVGLVALTLAVSACGSAPSTPRVTLSPSASPFVSTTTADYRLELQLSKLAWQTGEPMTGKATLRYLGRSTMNLVGSGSGLIAFDYVEAGGGRQLMGVSTADCAPHDIAADAPIAAPLAVGGAYDPANPSDDWQQQVMNASGIQLPAGVWDVTARTDFTEGTCDGPRYNLSVTVRVTVGG